VEDGRFSETDWESIYTEGGAGAIPSGFGIEYGDQPARSTPSTGYAWLCSGIGLFLLVPSFVGFGLAVRCIRHGNRWGWLAVAGAVASVAGYAWMFAEFGFRT